MRHGAKVKRCSFEGCTNQSNEEGYAGDTVRTATPLREECALSMEQKSNTNDAALKDAQINPNEEEYAGGMEQRRNAGRLYVD